MNEIIKKFSISDIRLKKWVALDIIKFIAVVIMVFVHIHLVLVTDTYRFSNTTDFYYQITSNLMFVGLFVFLLPMTAGAILRMNFGERLVHGKLKNYKINWIISMAVFIALLGFLMNWLTWGVDYIFAWNVLQLVALSFIVITLLLRLFSIRALFLASIFSIFMAEPLRNFLGGFDSSYLAGVFVGNNSHQMFWPFFPWFGVVGLGFLIAHYYLKYKDSVRFRVSLIILGIFLIDIAIFRDEISPYLDPGFAWGSNLFQPKIGWILAVVGLFCFLVGFCNTFLNKIHLKKYGIINSYSKGILWIYIVQMFVSCKIAVFFKDFFPLCFLSWSYFILLMCMLLLSWLVGALSIKFLQAKQLRITLRKIKL
ncbi:MAG: DUF1624 domain-containing protein [Candidatus Pacebacteria bacterium]|nr:DUF1624 domain-containing protein [Candidatus Paceibacterota bacterium]